MTKPFPIARNAFQAFRLIIPFQSGIALTWDATVNHTLAENYAHHTDIVVGHAAEHASTRK